MRAVAKFNARADTVNSLLCVGLDTEYGHIPASYQTDEFPQFAFNRFIIDQTHPYAAAYKPNMAFYEARGERGLHELKLTMEYLRQHHPDILTICDAKRADIGSTNEAYASAIFDELGFDAVTLHPYLGREALQPFLARADKGCIILCRTSNPGAGEFQDLQIGGRPLWLVVAEQVSREWNGNGNCMLVVGATYPDEMRRIRESVGDMTFLVPGIGAQGGDVQATVRAGLNHAGKGIIVNASRSILFADDPAAAARALRDEINRYR
ncbi:MAG: orotidine-5'-phosphate decarboxylase [Chloroflexi bacterium]|nr:orotidine-5'-phosphate decarboxylase [Chloroflexota bacterium]